MLLAEWDNDVINKYTPIWCVCSVSHWQGCTTKIIRVVGGGGTLLWRTKGGSLSVESQLDSEIQLFLYKFAVLINENYFKTHSHIFFKRRNRNPPIYVAKMKAKVIYSKCSFSLTLVPFSIRLPPHQCQRFPQAQGWSGPTRPAGCSLWGNLYNYITLQNWTFVAIKQQLPLSPSP